MANEHFEVVLNQPMELGECPIWHPMEQALYWIDIDGRAVHRFIPSDGSHASWSMPSEPGCIAWCHEGGMLVALRSGLVLLDTGTGKLSAVAAAPFDPAIQRFNDGRCDAMGRLWVGAIHEPRDRPGATLYCVEKGRIRDDHKPVVTSNGVAFSPDHKTLYHADTRGHKITAYDYDLELGTTGTGRVFKQFSDDRTQQYGGRPDGAAVDSEGCYWSALYEGGCLVRLSPAGEVLARVAVPFLCPTMACFGGADLRTLYLTSARAGRSAAELSRYPLSGYLVRMRVAVAGLPEPGYRR